MTKKHPHEELAEGLAIATEHLGLEIGIVSHIDGETYTVEHFHAPEGMLELGQRFALGQTYCSITMAADDIVTIDEMGRSKHRAHPCYGAFQLESYIGIPIWVRGRRYGTLNFSARHRRSETYGKAERGLVRLLATWVEGVLAKGALEQTTREAEEKLRVVYEQSPDGFLLHRDGVIIEANPAMATIVGFDRATDLVGRKLLEFIPDPPERDKAIQRLQTLGRGAIPEGRHQLRVAHRDGGYVWIEASGVPVEVEGQPAALTIVRDLRERDEFQRSMQTQRLASIGAMAAGISHDLRNPLTSVLAGLDFATEAARELETSPDVEELREVLHDCQLAGEQMRAIIGDLLAFSRRKEGRDVPYEVHSLLESAANLAKSELRGRVQLIRDYQDVPLIQADAPRLTQVFVNLLVNAAQAVGDEGPAHHSVRIETRVASDGRVSVTLSDTGPGIAPENLDRIFERFYSTKPARTGTGLGLTLSRDIVIEHGGTLTAENRPEGGARFTVALPPSLPSEKRASETSVGGR